MGSGIYVIQVDLPSSVDNVEAFARTCLDEGLMRGFSPDSLRQAFGKLLRETEPRSFIVVDSDLNLARVLAAEISEGLRYEVRCTNEPESFTPNSCVLVTEASSRTVPSLDKVEHRIIQLNSMQDLLIGRERPAGPILIAVISSSDSVRRWAATLLAALGFSADSVVLRRPADPNWADGLMACDIVAADVLSAPLLKQHSNCSPVIFRLVSLEFISELRVLLQQSERVPGK
jgi:hypothetical protein